MYHRKYKDTSDELYDYLENLYENSSHFYINKIKQYADGFQVKNDLISIYNYMSLFEEYIHDLEKSGFIYTYEQAFKVLKEIKIISVLPQYIESDIETNGSIIQLHPNLNEEEIKNYLYSQFTQLFHDEWLNDISYYFDYLGNIEKQKESIKDEYYIEEAFKMLNNVTKNTIIDKLLDKEMSENCSENILENAVTLFSNNLTDSEESSLEKIAIYSMENTFVKRIIAHYNRNFSMSNKLYDMLVCMGKINREEEKGKQKELTKKLTEIACGW